MSSMCFRLFCPTLQIAGQQFSINDIAAPSGAVGGMFPKRLGVQVSKDSAPQAAGSDLFPQRLGVHVNEYRAAPAPAPAAGDGLFHKSTGIKGTIAILLMLLNVDSV